MGEGDKEEKKKRKAEKMKSVCRFCFPLRRDELSAALQLSGPSAGRRRGGARCPADVSARVC